MSTTTREEDDDRPVRYAHRPRPFSHEVSWRLEADAFVVDSGRKTMRVPYSSVARVRLSYRPSNGTSQGYRARIILKDGCTITASNLSWQSYVAVDRLDGEYRKLLSELLQRCGRANPDLVCLIGQPAPLWIATTVGGLAMLAVFASVAAWAILKGSWPMAAIACLFLVPFAWQAHAMITKNRPGVFTPDRLPESVLPPAS